MSLPLLAARPLVRRSALQIGRRLESTATGKATDAANKAASTAKQAASKTTETAKDATAKATATASEYAGKAQQGLSRVTSSAGPAIANAAKGVSGALSKVGGRTGKLVAFVERMFPPLLPYESLQSRHLSRD
jgi:F-type H+-transporting ATPase subunit g